MILKKFKKTLDQLPVIEFIHPKNLLTPIPTIHSVWQKKRDNNKKKFKYNKWNHNKLPHSSFSTCM